MTGPALTLLLSACWVISAAAAPVAPNETRVAGEVLEVSAVDSSALNVQPPQLLFRVRLRLVSAQAIAPKASFLRAKPGDVVEAYAKQPVPPDLVGRLVTARITFRGDERGGHHWILEMSKQ